MKFGTAHGRPKPEVGSAKCIEAYGTKGVISAPRIFDTSDEKMMTPTVFLGPKHNFYLLTVCRLNQYLPNGSEKSGSSHRVQWHTVGYYQLPIAVTAARSKYGKPICSVY